MFELMYLIFSTIIGFFAGTILSVISSKAKQNKITNKNKRNKC